MKLRRPFVQILTAIASLVAVPFAHATSGDSIPFLLDTRNYDDSTPLFSVDTRAPDLVANTGITDSGGNSFTISMEMLKVTGSGTITFTLGTGPVRGTLFLDGIAQGAGATFTQAQIDAGLSGGTIILGGTQLTIDKDLTIQSPPDGITVSGNGASRLFQINGPAVVED